MTYTIRAESSGHADEAIALLRAAFREGSGDLPEIRSALDRAGENLVLRFSRGESVVDL
jgi:hypothetical protein